MGLSDPQYTRLKTIILLCLIIFFIYSCELIFFGSSGEDNILKDFIPSDEPLIEKPTEGILDQIGMVIVLIFNFMTTIFQILTFTLPAIPTWMTIIMLPVMSVLVLTSIYISADFIYDIVKALPFT